MSRIAGYHRQRERESEGVRGREREGERGGESEREKKSFTN